jgi:hypothetical protein
MSPTRPHPGRLCNFVQLHYTGVIWISLAWRVRTVSHGGFGGGAGAEASGEESQGWRGKKARCTGRRGEGNGFNLGAEGDPGKKEGGRRGRREE